jgi:hypothetical protein
LEFMHKFQGTGDPGSGTWIAFLTPDWTVVTEMTRFLIALVILASPSGALADRVEHFVKGEIRGSLSWDNISAMESGVLKFGGAAGVHIANGIEVGYEQQFIVVPEQSPEGRSWGTLRMVPFRRWPVNPFLAVRLGYHFLPDQNAPALGAGCGAVLFVGRYLAFEASLFTQAVFHPAGTTERQTDFDWRVVLFF